MSAPTNDTILFGNADLLEQRTNLPKPLKDYLNAVAGNKDGKRGNPIRLSHLHQAIADANATIDSSFSGDLDDKRKKLLAVWSRAKSGLIGLFIDKTGSNDVYRNLPEGKAIDPQILAP
jgi:hypothetical protein